MPPGLIQKHRCCVSRSTKTNSYDLRDSSGQCRELSNFADAAFIRGSALLIKYVRVMQRSVPTELLDFLLFGTGQLSDRDFVSGEYKIGGTNFWSLRSVGSYDQQKIEKTVRSSSK